jgi:hypothetical protein
VTLSTCSTQRPIFAAKTWGEIADEGRWKEERWSWYSYIRRNGSGFGGIRSRFDKAARKMNG